MKKNFRIDKLVKPGESIASAINRLSRARAVQIKNNLPTDALDQKIELLREENRIRNEQKKNNPGSGKPDKWINYNKASKWPLKGGKMSPK